MFKIGSLALSSVVAVSLLFANPGNSQAQHGGGGHGGGGGGGGHGGGGGSYHGGGGGSYYHGGGSYYHGGGYDRGGYYGRSGFYGGIGVGIYAPYYGYSYPYYAPSYAPSIYVAPSYYEPPTTAYIPPTSLETRPPIRPVGIDPQTLGNAALVEVSVPPNAEVWFDDLKTKQSGDTRTFRSPELEPGKTYLYDVKAKWVENGDEVTRTRTVRVQAGRAVQVDFVPK
jgi:uncharacterized protein (TIGR03000 family)